MPAPPSPDLEQPPAQQHARSLARSALTSMARRIAARAVEAGRGRNVKRQKVLTMMLRFLAWERRAVRPSNVSFFGAVLAVRKGKAEQTQVHAMAVYVAVGRSGGGAADGSVGRLCRSSSVVSVIVVRGVSAVAGSRYLYAFVCMPYVCI